MNVDIGRRLSALMTRNVVLLFVLSGALHCCEGCFVDFDVPVFGETSGGEVYWVV